MFDKVYQSGFISLLYSVGPRPLQLCEKHEEVPGSVRRVLDEDVQSSVVELSADNLVRTWLRFPCGADEQQQELSPPSRSLHIRLRHLVLVLKNKKSAVHPQLALLPLHLDSGWNQVQVDLAELLYTTYKGRYAHTISVQLHASCRVRRIYFAETMFPESQLPVEFRLFKRLSKEQMQQFREQQQQQE
eukprot:jgi/Phyca11/129429/e_gw1.84.38.1